MLDKIQIIIVLAQLIFINCDNVRSTFDYCSSCSVTETDWKNQQCYSNCSIANRFRPRNCYDNGKRSVHFLEIK